MKKQIIFTENATSPTAHYSQAVRVGDTVYIAGLCGNDPKTSLIVGDGDMKVEAKYAMENLKATIEAAGGALEDIVKVDVYINDLAKMADFNQIYPAYFPKNPPARIAMEVSRFAGGAALELDAVAIIGCGK